MAIYVALRTAPRHYKTALGAKLAEPGDKAARDLTAHLMKALEGFLITKIEGYGASDANTPTL